jgi:CspA family cold shock protein
VNIRTNGRLFLANLLELESDVIVAFAERINSARKLYGEDSAYVIGMMASFEWMAEVASGGNEVLKELSQHIDIPKPETFHGKQMIHNDGPVGSSVPQGSAETLSENAWIKGVVKWFNNDKGYGFISTESKVDVFVHWRDISSWDRSLEQGDEVEFMVTRSEKGFQAINVMKTGSDDTPDAAVQEPESEDEKDEATDDQATSTFNDGEDQISDDIKEEPDKIAE